MIIGKGDIASVLTDREDRIYFAAGISNSSETNWNEFQREKDLLMSQNKYHHLVYFSTLSIYYNDTPYTKHKMQMEMMVRNNFQTYTIIRLGNITWGKNPTTLINYLTNCIRKRLPYEIQDTYRYLVSKEEFLHWINLIPDFSTQMNIPGRMVKVKDLVDEIKGRELILNYDLK